MLTLPIKKKWFDMIKSGEKKEEYREIKPYYDSRFFRLIAKDNSIKAETVTKVKFRNGYSKNSPSVVCNVEITTGYGKAEWGAEPGKKYFILKILSVEEISNVKD